MQFSFERFGSEDSANARAHLFRKIGGYEIVDPQTIIVNFNEPEILFHGDLNSGIPGTQYIYPKNYVSSRWATRLPTWSPLPPVHIKW